MFVRKEIKSKDEAPRYKHVRLSFFVTLVNLVLLTSALIYINESKSKN